MTTAISGPGADTTAPPAAPPKREPVTLTVALDGEQTIEEQLAAQADKLVAGVEAAIKPTADDELFDGKQFEVKATIDGESADKIQIGFSGTWVLDPNDPKSVELFEKMRLGRTFTFQIEAEVAKKQGTHKRGKNDEETITGHAVLKVIDVYQPSPEELI